MKSAMFTAAMSCLSFALAWIVAGATLPSIPQVLVALTAGTILLLIIIAYFDGDDK
jgi:purine-cytosine permease-like protein